MARAQAHLKGAWLQMVLNPDLTKGLRRVKLQRSPTGTVLGACFMIGAEDLSFVEPGTEYLTFTTRRTKNGLLLEIDGDRT